MDFVRAFKVAVIIAIIAAGIWLFREDHLCKRQIEQRIGPVELIEHPFGSQRYNVVPRERASFWKRGDTFPVVVTCWTDLGGIGGFEKR
jgi:hypothetical protein